MTSKDAPYPIELTFLEAASAQCSTVSTHPHRSEPLAFDRSNRKRALSAREGLAVVLK